jgi:hypothetical protein
MSTVSDLSRPVPLYVSTTCQQYALVRMRRHWPMPHYSQMLALAHNSAGYLQRLRRKGRR